MWHDKNAQTRLLLKVAGGLMLSLENLSDFHTKVLFLPLGVVKYLNTGLNTK